MCFANWWRFLKLQDLGNNDLTKEIYIVAHVMRIGKMLYSESSKKTDKNMLTLHQVFKRPHGIAIQNLSDVLIQKEGGELQSEEREFTLKVYQGEEKDFHQLHEQIIRQSGKYTALSCQPNYGNHPARSVLTLFRYNLFL